MARVTVVALEPGDPRDAARANSTISSWNTNSTNIDEGNFRDEAFDRRSIKKEFHEFGGTTPIKTQDGLVDNVTWTSVQELTVPFHIGGFNYTMNEDEIVVRLSLEGQGTFVAGTGDDELLVAIGYKTGSGGAFTIIPSTVRRIALTLTTFANIRKSVTITHRHFAGTDSDVWFTVLAQLIRPGVALRNWAIRNATLTAVLFKR